MKKITVLDSDILSKMKMRAVKSAIRKLQPETFIRQCMDYNLQRFKDSLDMLKHHPWIVNLCIKWAASSIGDKRATKVGDTRTLNKILQQTYDVMPYIPVGLKSADGIDFFFRNNLYQQLMYQTSSTGHYISREAFIFGRLDPHHKLSRRFFELTNLSVERFVMLSITFTFLISSKKNVIKEVTADMFSILTPYISREEIFYFLDSLSISYEELPDFCKRKTTENPLKEYFLPSPFIENPLIKYNDKFLLLHTQLTLASLQTFIYDLLRRDDPEKFMDSFGSIFENLVKDIFDESKIRYIDEQSLKKHLPQENKVVDFLIPHEAANIFIDAKGVEIHERGMVTLSHSEISGRIKNSVLKTIEQAHAVNREILNSPKLITDFKSESYILCITYKNLMLGNGTFLEKSYATDGVSKIRKNHDDAYQIPDSHIFCISIEEFEYLMSSCKEHGRQPYEVLRYAVEMNRTPSQTVFLFIQHLEKFFGQVTKSEMIRKTGLDLLERMTENIPGLKQNVNLVNE
ncbi:GapS1 family protein [Klebsiella pneumoniae]